MEGSFAILNEVWRSKGAVSIRRIKGVGGVSVVVSVVVGGGVEGWMYAIIEGIVRGSDSGVLMVGSLDVSLLVLTRLANDGW